MTTKTITQRPSVPAIFDEFLKPWSPWFDENGWRSRSMSVPAVNISEKKDHYEVSLAAPGLQKSDFQINLDGNVLSISSEKEETKKDENEKVTRQEYSYRSFSRSFTLPEDVKQDGIDARYENGELKIKLPRKEGENKHPGKRISIK